MKGITTAIVFIAINYPRGYFINEIELQPFTKQLFKVSIYDLKSLIVTTGFTMM
jgi:hypothetical protein